MFPPPQSPNAPTVPREKMYRITTMYPEDPRAPFYDPSGAPMQPLARLYVTREAVVPKPCGDDDDEPEPDAPHLPHPVGVGRSRRRRR